MTRFVHLSDPQLVPSGELDYSIHPQVRLRMGNHDRRENFRSVFPAPPVLRMVLSNMISKGMMGFMSFWTLWMAITL